MISSEATSSANTPRNGIVEGRPRRAHFVGIAGTGMQALAAVLLARGWQLSGSDSAHTWPLWLLQSDVHLSRGHRAVNVPQDADLLIYSPAIDDGNAERRAAAALGIPERSYPEMIAELMRPRRGIAVAGTHGKSTSAAMLAAIFAESGFDPTVLAGGAPLGEETGGRHGTGPWLIAEACEYRRAFHLLTPEVGLILNIEPDHFDCFSDDTALDGAFAAFIERVDSKGTLLVNADSSRAQQLATQSHRKMQLFTSKSTRTDLHVAWRATDLRHVGGRYEFTLEHCPATGREPLTIGRVRLSVPGRHQVDNALAAAATALSAGCPARRVLAALARHRGVSRRLEHLATISDIDLVDDYAHHPTEIRAGLRTLRSMYPGRRLWCIFQPHQVSRTRPLLDALAASLENADRVWVDDVFAARESAGDEVTHLARQLAERISGRGTQAEAVPGTAAVERLQRELSPGDVVVTMGAGDIRKVVDGLAEGFFASGPPRRGDCAAHLVSAGGTG